MSEAGERPRVAFVVQRYDAGIAGGSERLCRAVAERLARVCDCTVLTTCASDYMTWANEFPPGASELNGVGILRFPVEKPRDVAKFNAYSEYALKETPSFEEEERWMRMQGPVSEAMLDHLRRRGGEYDAVIFFTYLYATTYFGLPLVKERAILVPTAHDEPPIYLSIFDPLFRLPRRLLFMTNEERDFVYRRFSLPEDAGEVAGMGMEPPCAETSVPPALAAMGGKPYLLYLGRIDPSKGCETLIAYFLRYVKEHPASPLHLALAGQAMMDIPKHPRILATGYVTEAEKNGCIAGAMAMVAPSPYESLCIAALEAWMRGKPVVANGDCQVLAGQCQRSGGGLWYRGYEEFAACVDVLASREDVRTQLGRDGAEFVERHYSWEAVEEKYLRNIQEVCGMARVAA